MYGIFLHWERDADGTWCFTVGEEKVEGFWAESSAIRAGFKRLKELEAKKMEELEMELLDVSRSIEDIFLAPQHIGELSAGVELNVLLARQNELRDTLDFPPDEERDRQFD